MNTPSNIVTPSVTEEDIHAYVDGILDRHRRSRVEAYLAAHPEEAARVEAYRAQNIGLHVLFDTTPYTPLPNRLVETASQLQGAMRRQRRTRSYALLAASVCALAVTGVLGWLTFTGNLGDATAGKNVEVAAAPASEETASDGDQFYPPFDRISGGPEANTLSLLAEHYAGAPMQAPNLETLGFKLVVQRVFPTPRGPGVQLLYQNQQGDWITLYIGGDQRIGETKFSFVKREGVSMAYWRRGSLSYGLSGGLQREELAKLAQSVSEQLGSVARAQEGKGPPTVGKNVLAPMPNLGNRQREAGLKDGTIVKPDAGTTVTPVMEESREEVPAVSPLLQRQKATPPAEPVVAKKPKST